MKYKSDAVIKEVIRLDMYSPSDISPYYDSSPPLWEVEANSMSSLWRVP